MIAAVRYLRMLTNAMAGGVLVALYLVVLVLQLNPQVPTISMTSLRWLGALLAFYGPYLVVALYLLILVREAVASRALKPAWLSVRILAWLGAVGAATTAVVTWANLSGFRAVLGEAPAERMRQGATATTIFAVALVSIAVLRYSFGRRGSRPAGWLLAVSMVLSVTVPLWLRGPGETSVPVARRWTRPATIETAPRVRLLVFDGASLGFIRQRVAAGQLPNFARLLDRGATMSLATLKPTEAEPVWASAATGKLPPKTGVRSNAIYRVEPGDTPQVDLLPDYCFAYALVRQGFVGEDSQTTASLTGRAFWDVLADYGLSSGITGWPMTYPARAERGYIVTDRVDEAVSSPLRLGDARAGDPTTAIDVARQRFDAWQARPWREVLPADPATLVEPDGLLRARWDRAYSDTAAELEMQFAPRLTAVRYEGLEALGHLYLREALPELFGDPRRTSPSPSVLDRHYTYLDGEVGRALRASTGSDLLIIMSGYGMQQTPLWKRLVARVLGDPDLSGTHEPAPDGFLIAYGANVARGQYSRGAIVDLAPTVLYYMGVAVGRDMDGFARTDLFTPTYTLEHLVKYVGTHER